MKKFSIIILLIFSLLLIGCSDENGGKEPDGPDINKTGNEGTEGAGNLKLYFFELGKADAFIIYNNKTTILIDTGAKGDGKDILQYMENNNITKIDYMFITHFDQDHVGGANKVLGNTEVGQIYTSNYPKESEEYTSFMSKAESKKIPNTVLRENLTFEENGIKVEVNVPVKDLYENDPSNNSSLIIRITYGENSFLFMGDAEEDRIREYLSTTPAPCDVLKVPYHGHYMGCLSELVDAVKPKYAVITSSKEEKEADETKDLLSSKKVDVRRTRKGSVFMQSDGKEIMVSQGA